MTSSYKAPSTAAYGPHVAEVGHHYITTEPDFGLKPSVCLPGDVLPRVVAHS